MTPTCQQMTLHVRDGQTAALRPFACFPQKYVFVLYFLFLLQSAEILQIGTVVASVL